MANEMSKSIKDFDVPSALLPEKLRKDGKLWLSVPEFIVCVFIWVSYPTRQHAFFVSSFFSFCLHLFF